MSRGVGETDAVGNVGEHDDMKTKGAVEDVVEVPYDAWERIRAEASDVFGQVVATTAGIAALQRKLAKRCHAEEEKLEEAIAETERTSRAEEKDLLKEIEEEEEKCALVQRELEQLKSVAGEEESWRRRVEAWMKIKLAKENAILSKLEVENQRCNENRVIKGRGNKQTKALVHGDMNSKEQRGSVMDPNVVGETGPAQQRTGREAYLRYRERHGMRQNTRT